MGQSNFKARRNLASQGFASSMTNWHLVSTREGVSLSLVMWSLIKFPLFIQTTKLKLSGSYRVGMRLGGDLPGKGSVGA